MDSLGDRAYIRHLEQRIRERFKQHDIRWCRLQTRVECVEVGHVTEANLRALRSKIVVDQRAGRAIEVLRTKDAADLRLRAAAWGTCGEDGDMERGHARGERTGATTIFGRRNHCLKPIDCWISKAAVDQV